MSARVGKICGWKKSGRDHRAAMAWPDSSKLPRWEKLSDAPLAHTPIFDLQSARYRHPGRAVERDFVVLHPPDWVNVVAVTPEREVVLVRQFRFGTDAFSWEVPGGVIERGEDPVAAGVRELGEETGYVGVGARKIGWVHPNPAIQSNRCHFVLVEAAVPSAALAWDPDEEIEVATASLAEVRARIDAGEITHGLTLNALLFFQRTMA